MSVILGLDTSGEKIILCLKVDTKTDFLCVKPEPKKFNAELLETIDFFLKNNSIGFSDVDIWGVVVGPGSFTGIRIAVSTINAFAFAYDKPVVEVTSLEQLFDGRDKLVLMDCKHDNYYVGKYIGGEVEYLSMHISDINKINLPKEIITESMPDKILLSMEEKVQNKKTVKQAKPFYIKSSSAER